MLKYKLLFWSIFTLLSGSNSIAQNFNDSLLIQYRTLSVRAETDSLKYVYSDSLRSEVKSFLNLQQSFNRPLTNIPYLGDIFSPDGAFRMITWNLSLTDGTYDYFCFIQKKQNQEQTTPSWYELLDHHKEIKRPESRSLKKDNWYGALYYGIIPFKKDKEYMYVLLGWEGHNKFSNKKIIECLYFNNKGEPIFGKSVFESDRMNKRRVIFEYSNEAYLMLRYNEKMKQIVFNRLEPSKPELKGIYSFYQPTLKYDSYEYKKGNWVQILDTNPRNEKSNQVFHNPKDLKPPKK
jgi:hypothetical protein